LSANKDALTAEVSLVGIGVSILKDCNEKRDNSNTVIKYLFIGDCSKKVKMQR